MQVNITPRELQLIDFFHYYHSHLWISVVIGLVVVWSLIWKGIALWKAARNHSMVWYIVLLVLNTLGILEIIYIFAIPNKNNKEN